MLNSIAETSQFIMIIFYLHPLLDTIPLLSVQLDKTTGKEWQRPPEGDRHFKSCYVLSSKAETTQGTTDYSSTQRSFG